MFEQQKKNSIRGIRHTEFFSFLFYFQYITIMILTVGAAVTDSITNNTTSSLQTLDIISSSNDGLMENSTLSTNQITLSPIEIIPLDVNATLYSNATSITNDWMESATISTNQTLLSTIANIPSDVDCSVPTAPPATTNFSFFFENQLGAALNFFNFSIAQNETCTKPMQDSSISLQRIINNLNGSIDDTMLELSMRQELMSLLELSELEPQIEFENEVKQSLWNLENDINDASNHTLQMLINGDAFNNFTLLEKQIFADETATFRLTFEKALTANGSQTPSLTAECKQSTNDLDKNLQIISEAFVNHLRDDCVFTYAQQASSFLDDGVNVLTEIFSMVEMSVGQMLTEPLPELEHGARSVGVLNCVN